MSPRLRHRVTGVEVSVSEATAERLTGYDPAGGGGDEPAEEASPVTDAPPVAPPAPEGGPTEPVQEPAEEPAAAEPVQEPAPPADDAQPAAEPAPAEQSAAPEESPEASPTKEPQQASSLSDDDYGQWTVAELKAEIRRRNEGRGDADRIRVSQDKSELIGDLRADDAQ